MGLSSTERNCCCHAGGTQLVPLTDNRLYRADAAQMPQVNEQGSQPHCLCEQRRCRVVPSAGCLGVTPSEQQFSSKRHISRRDRASSHHAQHWSPSWPHSVPIMYANDVRTCEQLPSISTHLPERQSMCQSASKSSICSTVALKPEMDYRGHLLEQAHACYAQLLSHLQDSRSINPSAAGPLYRDVTRPTVSCSSYSSRRSASRGTGPHAHAYATFDIPAHRARTYDNVTTHSLTSSTKIDRDRAILHSQPRPSAFDALLDRTRAPLALVPSDAQPAAASTFYMDCESPTERAAASLHMLREICEQSNWAWIDGLLLGGCLQYAMGQYDAALQWFLRIIFLCPSHAESITNAAATLYRLGRQNDAETCWRQSLQVDPTYLMAAEHLVGLLYQQRNREAVDVVSYVQDALRLPILHFEPSDSPEAFCHAESIRVQFSNAPYPSQNHDAPSRNPISFGSSGYALPDADAGRLLALIHAKGTILYGLRDVGLAATAFEEAIMISVGRHLKDIRGLVRYIQTKLGLHDASGGSEDTSMPAKPFLLLSPARARQTASAIFPEDGELPGLRHLKSLSTKRAAIHTTSSALLSLAKIFQDASSNCGNGRASIPQPTSSIWDILSIYYLSLSLQESPSTANNVGILLATLHPPGSASPLEWRRHPSNTGRKAIQLSNSISLAMAYYEYGLQLDPRHVHLLTNLGSLLKDVGYLDLAIQVYEQALRWDGNFGIALTNLANAVKDKGRVHEAIGYYRRAIQVNPNFAEAVCGLFISMGSVCDWAGRGGGLVVGSDAGWWHVDDTGMLRDARKYSGATGLTKQVVEVVKNQLEEAANWGTAILTPEAIARLKEQLLPALDGDEGRLTAVLNSWIGRPWEGFKVLRLVERAAKVLSRRWFLCASRAALLPADAARCLQRSNPKPPFRRPTLPSLLSIPPIPAILPFHTFTCPLSASDIRAIAHLNAARITYSTMRSSWLPVTVFPPPLSPAPQLHIGYVSSDFNNHPLAHLMQSVFGFHDKTLVKTHCYATSPSDGSAYRAKIEHESQLFRDASSWSSDQIANAIIGDGIHILVNLNGYTRGARNDIFAARLAPIQMSFMGFAGSLGAEWCDYILADTITVPPSTLRPWRRNNSLTDLYCDDLESRDGDWVYSENVIFCRDTFFCCDHAQSAGSADRELTWDDDRKQRWLMRHELFPFINEETVILGNFNQLYKIEPAVFRAWLRILDQVPRAILWLLRFPEQGEVNLRATATSWAGKHVAERIFFTDVAPKDQHISRARVCDLVLDTPECNAHTTAADVLWSSTPLLTLPRYPYKMCSRIAASILRGALPKSAHGETIASELIARTEQEYEETAVRLASGCRYDVDFAGVGRGQGRLAEMRKILWEHKWTCSLFDTRRWVSEIEMAYTYAWRDWVAGESRDIHL